MTLDDDSDEEERDEDYGCLFPSDCCMPFSHLKSECFTADMAEEWMKLHEEPWG